LLRPKRLAARLLGLTLAVPFVFVAVPAAAQEATAVPPAATEASTAPAEAPPAAASPEAPTEAPAEAPAAAPTEPPPPPPPTEPPAAAVPDIGALLARPDLDGIQRLQLELLRLLNQRRAEAGLPPLAVDQRLVQSASEHSHDMAARRFCRHRGSDGSSVRARIARQGYPYNNWAGENIICARRSAEAAMQWWMNSRPHRKNILHRSYTHLGIGVDPNGPWGPMWTLNFAAGAADTVRPALYDPPPPPTAVPEAPPAPAEPPPADAPPAEAQPAAPPPADPAAAAGGSPGG
jgi:uncharacterized protein YkwD